MPKSDEDSDIVQPQTETVTRTSVALKEVKRDTRELWEVLASIESKLDDIQDRLHDGDTAMALLEHRVSFLEKLVYGVCGALGISLVGAVAALVIKTGA
jgi:hypothetical protein